MVSEQNERVEEMATCPTYLIAAAFTKWTEFLHEAPPQYNGGYWKLTEHIGTPLPDILLENAFHLLIPYAELVLPTMDEQLFSQIKKLPETHKEYAGLFYTALLNTGKDERRLCVPKETPPLCFWGYKLQKGSIDLYANSLYYVGYKARGGEVTNYGNTLGEFCTGASGGEHTNRGKVKNDFASLVTGGSYINENDVQHFGQSASGGTLVNENTCMHFAYSAYGNVLCVNRGSVQKTFATGGDGGTFSNEKDVLEHFGWQRRGGVCINRGSTKELAYDAIGGIYIIYELPQRIARYAHGGTYIATQATSLFLERAKNAVCITTEQLAKDVPLAQLIKKLEITLDNVKIQDAVVKISDHCKRMYKS